jgi:FAD-linked sulfhydryl oxidase
MDPTVWGPHYWIFLHTVAENYPKYPNAITRKTHYRLFHNFHEFIPHQHSARNFRALLELYPVTAYLDSRSRLVQWVNFIHNKVNETLGKPAVSLQEHHDAMRETYDSKSKKWDRYVKNNFLVVTFIFIVMIASVAYAYS